MTFYNMALVDKNINLSECKLECGREVLDWRISSPAKTKFLEFRFENEIGGNKSHHRIRLINKTEKYDSNI